ncbi:MAG: PilZ domain-containing protein [Nitrospirae bacterium]|nr:PilZ domain-containing protein [Nitrospirota bacterium]
MERRTYERLSAKLQAKLFYANTTYTGTVSNLSESGMFICTKINFPIDSMFAIALLQNGQSFKITIQVKRTAKTCSHYPDIEEDGIGVVLLDPPHNYLEFVGKCRTSHD